MITEELEKWADSRQTSIEVAQAIDEIAPKQYHEGFMASIWQDPSFDETASITERAFELADKYASMLGRMGVDELHWGQETIQRPS
jgi:hypothetical protein